MLLFLRALYMRYLQFIKKYPYKINTLRTVQNFRMIKFVIEIYDYIKSNKKGM